MTHANFVGLSVFLGFLCFTAFTAAVCFGIACAVSAMKPKHERAAQYLWQITCWFMIITLLSGIGVVVVIYTG